MAARSGDSTLKIFSREKAARALKVHRNRSDHHLLPDFSRKRSEIETKLNWASKETSLKIVLGLKNFEILKILLCMAADFREHLFKNRKFSKNLKMINVFFLIIFYKKFLTVSVYPFYSVYVPID